MKTTNLKSAFEAFESSAEVKVNEVQKISGGTCIFYSSNSWGDCDKDDQTKIWVDQHQEPTGPIGPAGSGL